jgi:hypothetical protein
MQAQPTPSDLFAKIAQKHEEDLARFKAKQEAAVAAIKQMPPEAWEILASLFAQNGDPEATSAAGVTPAPEKPIDIGVAAKQATTSNNNTAVDSGKIVAEKDYGVISKKVRAIASGIENEFTARDIVVLCVDEPLNSTTVSGVLKKMENEKLIVCVERGAGKRPSKFKRAPQQPEDTLLTLEDLGLDDV